MSADAGGEPHGRYPHRRARVELRIGPVRWLALHTDYRVNALFGQLVA